MLSTPEELLGLFLKDEFQFHLRMYLGQKDLGLPKKPDGSK